MPFPRVKHWQAERSPSGQQTAVGLDGPAELRHVVAEHLAEPAGLEEIALHVDDDERAMLGREVERIRLGCDLHRLRFPYAHAEFVRQLCMQL